MADEALVSDDLWEAIEPPPNPVARVLDGGTIVPAEGVPYRVLVSWAEGSRGNAGRSPDTVMLVNGYEVEEAPNGAWWVKRPGTRRAWRFKTRTEALRFAMRLRAPDVTSPAPSPHTARRRGAGAG